MDPSTADEKMGQSESATARMNGSARAQKRKGQGSNGSKSMKKAERNDIQEIVEHLVVVGNHHRHQKWRQREYEKFIARKLKRKKDNQSVDGSVSELRQDENEEDASGFLSEPLQPKCRTVLLNVEDNLLYGQLYQTGGGDSVAFWPNPQEGMGTRTRIISDDQWETMWGDGVDPVGFSCQRLSTASHELLDADGNARKDLLHPSHETNRNDPSQAARSILLRCWHRAVHAASQMSVLDPCDKLDERMSRCHHAELLTTQARAMRSVGAETLGASSLPEAAIDVSNRSPSEHTDTSPRNHDELPTESRFGTLRDTRLLAEDQSDPRDSVSSSPLSDSSDSSHHSTVDDELREGSHEPTTNVIEAPGSLDLGFDVQHARSECRNLNIALSVDLENCDTFPCPVCRAESGSFEMLESHYYGTPTARGCSWARIERRRESLIEEALKAEISLQARQLAQLVAMRSIEPVKRLRGPQNEDSVPPHKCDLFRPAFDWCHVERIFEELFASALPQGEGYATSQVSEHLTTLNARLSITNAQDHATFLPPVLLNRCTLEAATGRLYARYSRLPK